MKGSSFELLILSLSWKPVSIAESDGVLSEDGGAPEGIVETTISEMAQKANNAMRIFSDLVELDFTNDSKDKTKTKGKGKNKDKDKDNNLPLRWCGGAPADMLPWSPQSLTAQAIHVVTLQL